MTIFFEALLTSTLRAMSPSSASDAVPAAAASTFGLFCMTNSRMRAAVSGWAMPYPNRIPAIPKIFEKVRTTITFGLVSIHLSADEYDGSSAYSKYASSIRNMVVSGASAIQLSISREFVMVAVGLFGLQK